MTGAQPGGGGGGEGGGREGDVLYVWLCSPPPITAPTASL